MFTDFTIYAVYVPGPVYVNTVCPGADPGVDTLTLPVPPPDAA
jgi:hypothetical protein